MSSLSSILLLILLVSSISSLPSHGARSSHRHRICRCLPADTCWPNGNTWAALNASVHGRLLRVQPPASPCHYPHYNIQDCNVAKQRWHDSFWRSDQAGAMQYTNWEMHDAQNCLIGTNRSTPCLLGAVAVYAVDAREASDVQEAVRFSAQNSLRLVIKSSGHDYLGRSTAFGSLSIWTHHLNNLTFHDKFTPDGCRSHNATYSGPAMTAGVGAQWLQVYEAADVHKVVVVGAGESSISNAGGYAQGGGHSIISPKFGLAADNILQFVVVTADAQLLTANECQNTDLFWALRGGGGGTFGVVVSATHKTHPPLTNVLFVSLNITTDNIETLQVFLKKLMAIHPSLSDVGWAGYFSIAPSFTIFGEYVHPNASKISSGHDPFNALREDKEKHDIRITINYRRFSSFLQMYKTALCYGDTPTTKCSSRTGYGVLLASRLIPREIFESSPAEVARTVVELLKRGVEAVNGIFVAGGAVAEQQKSFNAVNPAWRQALILLVNYAFVPEGTSREAMRLIGQRLSEANSLLREMTPASGSYMNEADYWEPDWQRSFFGEHYETLLKIKERVDPAGLFVCRRCVGSEAWSDDLNCIK